MIHKQNEFMDNVGLTEDNSLVHLLNTYDCENDEEINILAHSKYYSTNDFGKLLDSKVGFSILSLNIQNISSKFSNFETFLDSIERSSNNPISIIALQECWLHDSEIDIDNFNIPNYTMVHKNRLTPTDHGGLIIYVHNQFQCFDVNINLVSNRWEYLCIGLSHRKPRSKKYVICNVYRKPGGTTEEMTTFTNEFCNLLNELKRMKHDIYTCGDYNINLLNINSNIHCNNFFENVVSCGFYPKITLPTRIDDREGINNLQAH